MRNLFLGLFLIALATAPAMAGKNAAANQAARDQHHIDSQRGLADSAAANAARNQALSDARAAQGLPHDGYDNRAADNLANEAKHTAKADALLAGCPTCH